MIRVTLSRYPQHLREQQAREDARKVDRIVGEAEAVDAVPTGVTAGGDERRLRGVPAIGRGVSGAIPGTVPGQSFR